MWFLLACSTPPEPEPVAEVVTITTDGVTVDDMNALEDRVQRRLESYEQRIGDLEMQVSELQQAKLSQADQVGYDPSKTRLDAADVQAAITELALDVERMGVQEMGSPSSELFRIPQDPEAAPDGPAGRGPGEGSPPKRPR